MKRTLCPIKLLLAFLLLILLLPSLAGQERWKMQKLTSAIVFDGMPDEPAWDGIASFPMVTHLPVSGNTPAEPSDIRMAYDDQYLYVGGSLYVSDPATIRAVGKKRDMSGMTTDWIGIQMDTYNDKENALFFYTNPNGLRLDGTIFNDGTPTNPEMPPMSLSWNTFWDVRTRVDEKGWYAEIRIPISSLRFEPDDQQIIMGLTVFRWLAARNEGYIFPEIPLLWGEMSHLKPSRSAEVEFQGMRPKKPLYISPYLVTGFAQYQELNEPGTDYVYRRDLQLEPGLDVKYGINPNTTLDLTVNTDFAQVEADQQQFNLERFSLYFPEKRPFFLERSSIFDFELGGSSNLFYSRRIGLHEGSPVRIWGGARLNSRVNDWDIGFLDIQTASFEDLPSENFGVLRLKKRVFNAYSYAGGMVTSRIGTDGSYNIAYGLDGVIRLFEDEYLTIRWAQSFEEGAENNPFSKEPSRFLAYWERRKQEGFSYMFAGGYHGADFDPGIGLERFEDYWVLREDLRYTWISPDSSRMQTHNILIRNYHLNSVFDNSFLIYRINPVWTFTTKKGWGGVFNLIYNNEYLQEDFELLDPVLVPMGRYQYLNTRIQVNTPFSRPLYTLLLFEGGGYYDGIRLSPSVTPVWNIGASVELGGFYQFDFVRFGGRGQELRNHIAGFQFLYMFSTKLSFSGYLQYNTAIHKVISNLRFRYNPKEGTDLYLVFNEGRNTMLDREIPALPAYDARNVSVKFTYTFER